MNITVKPGRVAIVTGAAQGIGEGVAKAIAECGAKVVCVDVKEDAVSKVVDEIKADGFEAVAKVCDVSKKEECQRLVSEVVAEFGTVDILVNNAGINRDAVMWKMTEEQWDAVIAVNLKGVFMMSQAVAPIMKDKGFGRIINMSSSSSKGNFGQTNYAATKAGVNAMTWTHAIELGRYGITVNSICPGVIDTPMSRSVPPEVHEGWMRAIPLKRVGEPIDMAAMVIFFASDEANYITGQTIFVDGGMQTGIRN